MKVTHYEFLKNDVKDKHRKHRGERSLSKEESKHRWKDFRICIQNPTKITE